VEAWAGPWPIAERWWSEDASRRAYVQIAMRGVGGGGNAVLASFAGGQWQLEAVYD
jgi:protein ImuB